jgi:hypothetical protein
VENPYNMVKAKHKGARLAGFRGASDRENENPGRMYIALAHSSEREQLHQNLAEQDQTLAGWIHDRRVE